MSIRPLNDLVLVQIDPPEELSSIICSPDVSNNPLRKGTVLAVGPGRRKLVSVKGNDYKFYPTVVQPGDRVVFFTAAAGTTKDRLHTYELEDNQGLLPECDILFVFDADVKVEL